MVLTEALRRGRPAPRLVLLSDSTFQKLFIIRIYAYNILHIKSYSGRVGGYMGERKVCAYPGCDRLGRNKGFSLGKRKWGKYCAWHYKKTSTKWIKEYKNKKELENKECEICGWGEAPCDRNRINSKVGYIRENVIVLCPNCHRLYHFNVAFREKCLEMKKNKGHRL